MSGLRSNSRGQSDRSSLDALNRTIEGLEARLEDLLGGPMERNRREPPAERPPERAPAPSRAQREPESRRFDPVDEIRRRQQALDDRWGRDGYDAPRPARGTAQPESRRYDEQDYRASTAIPAYRARPAAPVEASRVERSRPLRAAPAAPAQASQGDAALREVAEALVNLRQELKNELSEGVAREMQGVRSELRNIRSFAENQDFAEDIREDVARLAASIDRLSATSGPDSQALRSEVEELRSLVEQMARQDSMHKMERRWDEVEDTLRGFDQTALKEEIVALAYRLDDIKSDLGNANNSPAIRALEDKLITMAGFVEQLGRRIQPNENVLTEHFSGLDQRLDEISRAIAATSTRAQHSADGALAERLENRLNGLARQLDQLKDMSAEKDKPSDALTGRLDALANRIEELSSDRHISKLTEQLDQLSAYLEQSKRASTQPELTSFLIDISKKIDLLDNGAVNDKLAERLDKIARRIDDIETRPVSGKTAAYDSALLRLEDRLGKIAAKLDETSRSRDTDPGALASLESHIANLSSMLNEQSHAQPMGMPPELDARMSAIEDYMASNDEYIIEAARQAAEAVLEAHTRNNLAQTASPADMVLLSELANDLRKLEGLSRNTDERTHRTFEALHETLLQIASRLDALDDRRGSEPAYEQEHPASSNHPMPFASFSEESLSSLAAATATSSYDGDTATTFAPPAAAKPVAEEKQGLLASLTRRFKSGAARSEGEGSATASARTSVNPAPALDPIDFLSSDDENELLEPGSGAPDVKKILERVRASQNAQRAGDKDGDNRADFIAAARRAAQAAALETMPERAPNSGSAKSGRSPKGASMLARYRRPLLLGIGAILLAMMAMPMVKSLVGSDAPPAQRLTTSAVDAQSGIASSAIPGVADQPVTEPSTAPVDETAQAEADRMQSDADRQGHLIDTRPIGGAPLPQEAPAINVAAPRAELGVAERLQPSATPQTDMGSTYTSQPDTAAPQAEPAIAIPAAITPASLAEAAGKGDALALFEIAARYTDGVGVQADRAEAAKWYKLSADRGFAPAQYRLGNMYEKANGVERNLPEAKRYYEMAASQGNAGAMHNLAVLLTSDAAGQPDYKAAADWFIKASELGVRDSQFNLAILYARGSGVQQSLEESYKWFAIAARDGDADAAQKRDDVAKAMKPEQLASAKAKVDAWKVTPLNEDANSVNLPDEWTNAGGVKTSSVDMQKAIRNIQAILNNNGFKAGTPDGKLGKTTVAAIREFQKSVGQTPDGRITDELVTALLARNK
ncbi:peptidoglycan-binding protein [Agrobacterium larrymoorei]|uniref:Localization factor PodJL n=1 Tax=Agrobacterium larrymoorei TaxID=160699 RepID=A0ABU0UJF5_9HYPH|nr:peptidoglycan-binding protein [Agrobacterium larrymoorei]MDQ1184983.1 localization factor PodJL [Agrobacterium larrymoorei]